MTPTATLPLFAALFGRPGVPGHEIADKISDETRAASFARAQEMATFLKAVGHDGRLLILCQLLDGERSVTDLERALDQRQSAVSQQLARLRMEGLVQPRREGQAIYYSIKDPRVIELLRLLGSWFAEPCGR